MQKKRQAERRPYRSASDPIKEAEIAAARKPVLFEQEFHTSLRNSIPTASEKVCNCFFWESLLVYIA